MGWDDLLSSVGGALGPWLGFSVISIGAFVFEQLARFDSSKYSKENGSIKHHSRLNFNSSIYTTFTSYK
jgi:hypothetical protein